jgi:ABC-2 type transport system ATP-binding protein
MDARTAGSRDGAAIVVRDLVKRYGPTVAVDGLSFEVTPGEVFALLGPNGAGKTTTVEILEGFRRADRGEISVLGLDPATQGNKLKPLIGVMPQEGGLYPAITPREALDLFTRFYPRARPTAQLLSLLGLEDQAETRFRRLSGGQKQRLNLALALVGEPRMVFLDEPTAGLDPEARRSTWAIIEELKERAVTVLLTTHFLEEAERLADRVAIINHGRLVIAGTPASLIAGDRSQVRLRTSAPVDEARLAEMPLISAVRRDEAGTYVLRTPDAAKLLVEVTALLYHEHIPILEIRVGQPSLEEVYLELTGAAP